MVKNVLVLGGTAFIGRSFCEALVQRSPIQLTLLNRGVTNPALFPSAKRLRCDRNQADQCKQVLQGTHWESIVDFTGRDDQQIRNILSNCTVDHYTYISSSAVDLSWSGDPLFSMAQNKLWCEHLVTKFASKVLIVRPGFVCGAYDYTNRFEETEGRWFWKGTREPVRPMIRAELLSNLMLRLVCEARVGIVRAGYH